MTFGQDSVSAEKRGFGGVPKVHAALQAYRKQQRVTRSTIDLTATSMATGTAVMQFTQIVIASRKQAYLSAPPTSTASKQLLNSAEQVYADLRSNLIGENAEKLLVLRRIQRPSTSV